MAYEIFISYRRSDTAGYAGRLYDRLTAEYGLDNVLFDVEAAGEAELLRSWVQRVVPKSAVILVLIGDRWIEDHAGRRRLYDHDDVVRLEIELALVHEIPIIPILVDGVPFPGATVLPDSIRALSEFKGYPIGNAFWESSFKRLVAAISSVVKTHVPILRQGVEIWNSWRQQNATVRPNLAQMPRPQITLANANLKDADLSGSDLAGVDLTRADLSRSNLQGARLLGANMKEALLHGATMCSADLSEANLAGADLSDADLRHAKLNDVDLTAANLRGSSVFGVSVWNAKLDGAIQSDLRLAPSSGTELTSDSIETSIIINVIMSARRVREVIDTFTTKIVLVIGRFTSTRKVLLEALLQELRERNYLPVLFDFQKPDSKDLTETVTTLANMARFVIADLSDLSTVPHALAVIAPNVFVPIQPILLMGQREFALFLDLKRRHHWVLEPYRYESVEALMEHWSEGVIMPAEAKVEQLRRKMM